MKEIGIIEMETKRVKRTKRTRRRSIFFFFRLSEVRRPKKTIILQKRT